MTPNTLPDRAVLLEVLSYNPETGSLTWRNRPISYFDGRRHEWLRWNTRYANKPAAALTPKGYLRLRLKKKQYMAHRLIWMMVHGTEPDQIDHINGVKSDNRIVNLRDVSGAENMRNRAKPMETESGIMGVYKNPKCRGWSAIFRRNNKQFSLGTFATIEEAAAVRKAAEREAGYHPLHGRPRPDTPRSG